MVEASTNFKMCEQLQKRISDNNMALPVANHFKKSDHSISVLECVILNVNLCNSINILIQEQALLRKLKTVIHTLI